MSQTTQLRRLRLTGAIASKLGASSFPGSDSNGLVIRDVQTYHLVEPDSSRHYTVVKVQTASGLAGFGEGGPVSQDEVLKARPLLVGKLASAYEAIRQQLARVPSLQAAVNIALLDAIGKQVKAPLFQVLGGPTRNRVRALTALSGMSDEALIVSLKQGVLSGFRAFLVPLPPLGAPNQGQDYVMAVRKRVEALREAGGEELDLVLKGEGHLTPGDASSLARALEQFHLLWFDEPCALSNLSAARKISTRTVTPLGFGTTLSDAGSFQELLREQIVDVLRPSLALNGITQIRKVAAMAETYYVAVAPHHNGGPIGTAGALHLAASRPNFFIQQIPFPVSEAGRKMRTELVRPVVETVKEGFVPLPTGPGLGIAVNEAALETYQERVR